MTKQSFTASAQRTIRMESEAVAALEARIDDSFIRACDILLQTQGRVIVTGMGKSGHIARKIAATLASTGTPAFFVHPGEASHGDMGMITASDSVIALSNSGSVPELLTLLPLLKRLGTGLISMTGNPQSTLATASDAHLDTGVETEACPLGLAPTSSTTTALVMGDALAIALLEARGFTAEDFAFSHPGGTLGKQLLLKVQDVMHAGKDIPRVELSTPISQALLEITSKGLGMTTVVDTSGALAGIFTDGDLRRMLDKQVDIKSTAISELMTPNCKTIEPGMLAAESLRIMEQNSISSLVVTDKENNITGVVHLNDLLKTGIV
ncbi:MAG: KpsF/GutQ family sugar-phosphate isomerase [Proteobacteria bacterium]|nr:KpsF/GutQ family sugar-phosphate isomerase [Pseudomonadota bacterium]